MGRVIDVSIHPIEQTLTQSVDEKGNILLKFAFQELSEALKEKLNLESRGDKRDGSTYS